jgi:hypothetical protein
LSEGFAEGWLLSDGLAPRMDQISTDADVLGTMRNQAKPQRIE